MRTMLAVLAIVAATIVGSTAEAGGPAKGVVELFTSQGCSSCPPADAALEKVIGEGNMVALAWHVDYWDYLGWKDTFSSPRATARQATYANHIGGGSYTPEFVVNGNRGASGSSVIAGGDLPVAVKVEAGKVTVGAGSGKADLILVNYLGSASVPIARGENAGRSITYRHIVTGTRKLASWSGAPIAADTGGGSACAVILQRSGQGEIIGAAAC